MAANVANIGSSVASAAGVGNAGKLGSWNAVKKAFNLVAEGSFEHDVSY